MSSHHIIREDQEPALIVLDYEHEKDAEVLGQLLEWSPVVITSATTGFKLAAAGYKVDVVIASSNSEYQDWIRELDVKVLFPENDNPILLNLLQKTIKDHRMEVNVFGSEPVQVTRLRSIETLTQFDSLVFYTHKSQTIYSKSGDYKKWLPGGRNCIIHPVQHSQGFAFTDKRGTRNMNSVEAKPIVFSTKHDGQVNIVSTKPFFFSFPI